MRVHFIRLRQFFYLCSWQKLACFGVISCQTHHQNMVTSLLFYWFRVLFHYYSIYFRRKSTRNFPFIFPKLLCNNIIALPTLNYQVTHIIHSRPFLYQELLPVSCIFVWLYLSATHFLIFLISPHSVVAGICGNCCLCYLTRWRDPYFIILFRSPFLTYF